MLFCNSSFFKPDGSLLTAYIYWPLTFRWAVTLHLCKKCRYHRHRHSD